MQTLVVYGQSERCKEIIKAFTQAGLNASDVPADDVAVALAQSEERVAVVIDPYMFGNGPEGLRAVVDTISGHSHPTLAMIYRGPAVGKTSGDHQVIGVGNMGFYDDIGYMAVRAKKFLSSAVPA